MHKCTHTNTKTNTIQNNNKNNNKQAKWNEHLMKTKIRKYEWIMKRNGQTKYRIATQMNWELVGYGKFGIQNQALLNKRLRWS